MPLPLRDVFSHPSIRELARLLAAPASPADAVGTSAPQTLGQFALLSAAERKRLPEGARRRLSDDQPATGHAPAKRGQRRSTAVAQRRPAMPDAWTASCWRAPGRPDRPPRDPAYRLRPARRPGALLWVHPGRGGRRRSAGARPARPR
ncbi:hypothetical protein P4200_01060 [Pseudomonas aeruginosa]|nr:hypothetical protein [Pseudomonas aeruginosa]